MAGLRVDAFARELKYATEDRLTGDEHRHAFAAFARQVRDEEIALQTSRGGAAPVVQQTVDGHLGAPLEAVRLGGHIRFDFKYLTEVALFALEVLRGLSPTDSGAYRDAWFAMLDGKEVEPRAIPPSAREIVISNTKPYSRKIQVGAHGFETHAHIVDKAAKAVRSRYGNIVRAYVTFVDLADAYTLAGVQLSGAKRYAAQTAIARSDVRGRVLVKTSTGQVVLTRATKSGKQVYAAAKHRAKGVKMRYPALTIRDISA